MIFINASIPWKIKQPHYKLNPPLRLIPIHYSSIGVELHTKNIYNVFHINYITQIIHIFITFYTPEVKTKILQFTPPWNNTILDVPVSSSNEAMCSLFGYIHNSILFIAILHFMAILDDNVYPFLSLP